MTDAALIGPTPPPGLHVMTLNVRRPVPHRRAGHPDAWAVRAPRLTALLQAERPSLLMLQEALPHQVELVRNALQLESVGAGRDRDGGGEATPVVFDPTRLRLLEHRQVALSATPQVAGSRSWGSAFPRIAVRAVFADRATGAHLAVLSTHLDIASSWTRRRQAAAVRDLAGDDGMPVIVAGDLNAGEGSSPLRELQAGRLRDAWEVADQRITPAWATFARYRSPVEGRRLDHLLVSPGVHVQRIGIRATAIDRGWASDHLPVQAVLTVPA